MEVLMILMKVYILTKVLLMGAYIQGKNLWNFKLVRCDNLKQPFTQKQNPHDNDNKNKMGQFNTNLEDGVESKHDF